MPGLSRLGGCRMESWWCASAQEAHRAAKRRRSKAGAVVHHLAYAESRRKSHLQSLGSLTRGVFAELRTWPSGSSKEDATRERCQAGRAGLYGPQRHVYVRTCRKQRGAAAAEGTPSPPLSRHCSTRQQWHPQGMNGQIRLECTSQKPSRTNKSITHLPDVVGAYTPRPRSHLDTPKRAL